MRISEIKFNFVIRFILKMLRQQGVVGWRSVVPSGGPWQPIATLAVDLPLTAVAAMDRYWAPPYYPLLS